MLNRGRLSFDDDKWRKWQVACRVCRCAVQRGGHALPPIVQRAAETMVKNNIPLLQGQLGRMTADQWSTTLEVGQVPSDLGAVARR